MLALAFSRSDSVCSENMSRLCPVQGLYRAKNTWISLRPARHREVCLRNAGGAGIKKPPEGGLAEHDRLQRSAPQPSHLQITAAMDLQTWSMFLLFSAATHMRPVSVPYTPNSLRRRTIWSLDRPE